MDYKEQAELNKALAAEWNKCSCIYKIGGMKPKEFLLLNATAITDLLARAEAAEARAEKAERERDAAVYQLRGDCEKCAHFRVAWNGCTPDFECPISDRCLNRDMWEWNGGEKEE